jgi:hypothetical protein
MPVPGVPTLQPVEKPYESPQQAGRAGAAVADLAETSTDVADTGLRLEEHVREAQKQVDMLAAQNQLKAAYDQYQVELTKTQNSRDVPGVIKQTQDNLNALTNEWAKSPAFMQIQMYGQSLAPTVQKDGQLHQIALMGEEGKIQLAQQGQTLGQRYAQARAAGDATGEQNALNGFIDATKSLVKTALMGPVEAADIVRKFREQGQELQIRNAISNPDPKVNQAIYDEINSDPKKFPDVTPEQLDALKGHALEAVGAHTRFQEWQQGQQAQDTMLRPLINKWTNPATSQFDEDKALSDVSDQFRDGKLTVTQSDVLTQGIKGYAADKNGAVKQQSQKFQDDVIKAFHDHKYAEADSMLERGRPWLEQNNLGEQYRGLMNYGDTQRREERAEYREDEQLNRQAMQDQSYATFGQLQMGMSQGKLYTDSEILNMAGRGPGKMLPQQVNEAMQMSHSYQRDPTYQAAVNLLAGTFPMSSKKSPNTEYDAIQSKRQAMTFEAWQQRVNENPSEDKVKAMEEVLKPAVQKDISDRVNAIFGNPQNTGTSSPFGQFVVDTVLGRSPGKTQSSGAGQGTPKDGDTKRNSSGDTVVFRNGHWGPQ